MAKPKPLARQLGYDFAQGITDHLVRLLLWIIVVSLVVGYFTPTDETDESWWTRSGVKIFTDKVSGCQYLRGQDGGLIRREGVPCVKVQ